MVLNKVCCLSLRMGSLVLLYINLISCVWNVVSILSVTVGDPTIGDFISENAPLYYSNMLLSVIGGLIFLATIVSITKKTPSNALLTASISFLIFGVIYCVCVMVILNLNDSFKNFYYEMVDKEAQKHTYDPKVREEYVKLMHALYGSLMTFTVLLLVCNIVFALYSVLVFYSYMAEMKENMANNVPRDGKANPEEGYGRILPPPYTSQYDDTQRPQYFVNV